MPVMKQLRIGSATYDTVGEASVTQVQTSGTKIATVTIDGTATDLYAPEGGGSGPEPSSTTPAMDGTAAAGTATTYARADHVHPSDTSKQDVLVSGTNIKTVGGRSLLGSGNLSIDGTLPSVSSAQNGMVLMVVNGTWMAQPLPFATTSQYGVVMVDGTTITAANGVISAGSGEKYEVTITLTNPVNANHFSRCDVYQQDSADPFPEVQEQLGTITSPTGSATFTVSMPYLGIYYIGASVAFGTATCTGGVSLDSTYSSDTEFYAVTGDGTIVSDGVNYDD